jgi:preprotein translocase subunit SecD
MVENLRLRERPLLRLRDLWLVGGALLTGGCEPRGEELAAWPSAPVEIEFRIAQAEPAQGLSRTEVRGEEEVLYLHGQPFVTSAHITAADAFQIPEGVILEVWFNEEGRERIESSTAANLGRRIAVVIDSVTVTAPEIVQTLQPDLALQIAMRLSPLEAQRLVAAVESTW